LSEVNRYPAKNGQHKANHFENPEMCLIPQVFESNLVFITVITILFDADDAMHSLNFFGEKCCHSIFFLVQIVDSKMN
jgi:hypothetical protein